MTNTQDKHTAKRIVVDLTMTVEEARQVIWTGRGPRESIGKLLETNVITCRDLAWAVRGAYSPQMRAASRTLLADLLGKPETVEATHRYGPEVIEGSRYLARQRDSNLVMASMLIGFYIGVLLFFIIDAVLKPEPYRQLFQKGVLTGSIVLGIVLLLLFGAYVISYWLNIKPLIDEYRNFRRARDGEDAVAERLRATLDNRWTIFRNLHLPDHKGDLDIVLVGPGGIWAIEVKAYGGTIRCQNGKWERHTKWGWKKLDRDPASQARKNAQRINDYLRRQAIPIRWVENAVVLSEPQPITNFHSPDTLIWLLPQVEEKATNLTTRTPPTGKEIEQIALLLKALAEKQIAREESSILRRIWP